MIRKSRVCSSTSSTAGPISTSGCDKAGRSGGEGRGSCPPCWLAPGSSAPRCSPFDDLGAADRAAGEDQWNDGQRQCEGADAATVPLRGNVEQCTLVAIRQATAITFTRGALALFRRKIIDKQTQAYVILAAVLICSAALLAGLLCLHVHRGRSAAARTHNPDAAALKMQLGAQDISVAGAGIRQSA